MPACGRMNLERRVVEIARRAPLEARGCRLEDPPVDPHATAAGAEGHGPEDTEWGQHEGALVDLDGNVIRFGSPMH